MYMRLCLCCFALIVSDLVLMFVSIVCVLCVAFAGASLHSRLKLCFRLAFSRGLLRGRAWQARPPSVGHGRSPPPMCFMLLPQLGTISGKGDAAVSRMRHKLRGSSP